MKQNLSDKVQKKGDLAKNKKAGKYRLALIFLVALQVLGVVLMFLMVKGRSSGGTTGSGPDRNLFPFWLIVLIPLIVAQGKKRAKGEDQLEKRYLVLICLGLLVLLGMAFFIFQLH